MSLVEAKHAGAEKKAIDTDLEKLVLCCKSFFWKK